MSGHVIKATVMSVDDLCGDEHAKDWFLDEEDWKALTGSVYGALAGQRVTIRTVDGRIKGLTSG